MVVCSLILELRSSPRLVPMALAICGCRAQMELKRWAAASSLVVCCHDDHACSPVAWAGTRQSVDLTSSERVLVHGPRLVIGQIPVMLQSPTEQHLPILHIIGLALKLMRLSRLFWWCLSCVQSCYMLCCCVYCLVALSMSSVA